jgi:hypothetical protein
LIELTPPFLSYLRADGIVLPSDEEQTRHDWSDSDSGIFENPNDDDDEDGEDEDVASPWREIHETIKATIEELDGRVVPKLNWSAPKDATWISALNSMECRSANDIYLLLKSSDFVTHDLEHAFDDCVDDEGTPLDAKLKSEATSRLPYYLVLRKYFQLNPSLEFRCFVRKRRLLAACQRDLNHFEFLFKMEDALRQTIQEFFDLRLRDTFPDENFVFDVYIPPPHDKVWLVDINPWAQRTDPLLFSWLELLTMPDILDTNNIEQLSDQTTSKNTDIPEADEEDIFIPEIRLVQRDDPEAYNFNTQQYSAHKLPREVVDATTSGAGPLKNFAEQWKEMLAKQQEEQSEDE